MPRRRTVTEKQIAAPHWEAHETVLIRSLREQDNEAIQDELAEMKGGLTDDAAANMKLLLGTTRRLTMLRGIVSWTLTNADGSELPRNMKSIVELFPEDADFIYSEINKLNQPVSEAEKKESSTPAEHGSKATVNGHQTQLSVVK